MRRVKDDLRDERGAIAVVVAVLMVVILGFAAISLDVAKLYSERAQLQNGADAVALMVAQKCAKNGGDPNCHSDAPLAKGLAGSNALDGASNVKSIVIGSGSVQVQTGAEEAGASINTVSSFFAGVLGYSATEVGARSSAIWGSPRAGRAPFPLAFSICQVEGHVDGAIQRLMSHAVSKDKGGSSCINKSGKEVPGGFGYLPTANGACAVDVDLAANGGWAPSDPGVNEPELCTAELYRWASEMNAGREVIVFLPVFDEVRYSGKNADFHLVSFAAFKVVGWRLSGDSILPYSFRNQASTATGVTSTTECVGGCRGFIGRFVKFVSLADGFALGPVDANGAYIVRLTP